MTDVQFACAETSPPGGDRPAPHRRRSQSGSLSNIIDGSPAHEVSLPQSLRGSGEIEARGLGLERPVNARVSLT